MLRYHERTRFISTSAASSSSSSDNICLCVFMGLPNRPALWSISIFASVLSSFCSNCKASYNQQDCTEPWKLTSLMRRREYFSSMILMRSSISRITSSRVSTSVSAHLISASNSYAAETVHKMITMMKNKPDLEPQIFNLIKQGIDQRI